MPSTQGMTPAASVAKAKKSVLHPPRFGKLGAAIQGQISD
jgi:hypothetical protein